MNLHAIRGAALFLMLAPHTFSAELKVPTEGWVSWRVPAVDDAPDWCCWDWHGSSITAKPCRLDTRRDGYGSRDGAKTDSIRVYALIAGGKPRRVQALSATCPVEATATVQDLGTVSADDSARWLAALVQPKGAETRTPQLLGRDALAALAIHHGTVAHDSLAGIARNDVRKDNRKEAVFWLAHLRGVEGARTATAIMFGDDDADVREHAAFAVSQSGSPQAASDLIRLANADKDSNVRARAFLWLAKTESAATEAAIDSALRKEGDEDVRRQAIFALSQLPPKRATDALIAVAEDRSRPSEDRKQAVFWLAQSEAVAAQTYLERVLTR